MKKVFLLCAMSLVSVAINAQTYVGVKGTPSLSRMKFKGGVTGAFTIGNSFGAFVEHQYKSGLVAGAEMLFENRTSKSRTTYTDNLGNPIPSASIKQGFYAVSLPIYAGFKSTFKTVYIGATAGLIPAITLTQYFLADGFPNAETNKRTSFSSTNFDLSPMVNICGGVSVKRLQIGLQGRYQQSVIGITTAGAKTNAISAFLSVGYKL